MLLNNLGERKIQLVPIAKPSVIIYRMKEEILNEHIDDTSHDEKIGSDLSKAMEEQKQMKRLVDLFILALFLIVAMYSFF
jgi:hypothetical protein